MNQSTGLDVLIVGAGPTGLACGIEAGRAGLHPLIVEDGRRLWLCERHWKEYQKQ